MKPGRNQPCPCGSGKKYKKCCYLKGLDRAAETAAQLQALEELEELEENTSTHELMIINAINKMRRISLDKKSHIKEYDKARKLHGEIVDSMVQYYESGKFRQKQTIDYIAAHNHKKKLDFKQLHLLQSEFDLETRVGVQSLYDLLIYKVAPHMNCITEDFIQNHRYRRVDKLEFLQSMLDSKLGLFEVVGVDFKEAYAYLKEVFSGAEYKITDIGLSGSGESFAEVYLYTRIIQYKGVCFGTGLNYIFAKDDSFVKNYISKYKKNYAPEEELHRFIELYNHYSQHPEYE